MFIFVQLGGLVYQNIILPQRCDWIRWITIKTTLFQITTPRQIKHLKHKKQLQQQGAYKYFTKTYRLAISIFFEVRFIAINYCQTLSRQG